MTSLRPSPIQGSDPLERAREVFRIESAAVGALADRLDQRFAQAVDLMRPVLGGMYRLGGSHAQQDVLEQLFLDATVKAGLSGDTRTLLERVAGRHKLPPSRRIGYAAAARELGFT